MKPYIRVFFKDAMMQRWADIPLPDGTSFVQYMGQVHFEGFLCAANFYIPVDQIKFACPIQRADATGIDYGKGTLQ